MINIKTNFAIFVLPFVIAFFVAGCGNKKDDTMETKKDIQQTQQSMTQNTQQKDTITEKKDTTTKTDTKEVSNKVMLETSMGKIEIELYEKDAPKHVANFKKLVNSGFYEGTTFHRVIPDFMIQCGDPNSKDNDRSNDGVGGPGYTIPAEIKLKHVKGSVAAARMPDQVNPNKESSGSQFYIVTGEASHLDGNYTVFGKVVKGFEIAEKIQNVERDNKDNPINKVVIKKVYFVK
jgi:cyclophilin family peptidyl-prolyl cis-trans isomerase